MPERLLYNALQTNPELKREFDNIYNESLQVWQRERYEHFTVHGEPHTKQVELNLDELTRYLQNSPYRLTLEEIFVLLSACCLHDIGMQRDVWNSREIHAQLSYELIINSSANNPRRRVTLPISDDNARRAIAYVARAHWVDHALQIPSNSLEPQAIYGTETGRLKLLGLLLAMADLLDLSPVRARYFRTLHRLSDLGPRSELHQSMHQFVRLPVIYSPNEKLKGRLQFRLEWRDDGVLVHQMCEWVMKWFDSQWRQLKSALEEESNGLIQWVEPWAAVRYNPREERLPTLGHKALAVLQAERAEQARLNRDKFVKRFQKLLKPKDKDGYKAALIRLPSDSGLDGELILNWCAAHAKIQENEYSKRKLKETFRVARYAFSLPFPSRWEVIQQLMKQWEQEMDKRDDDEALAELSFFLSTNDTQCFVSIIETDEYREDILQELLKALVKRPPRSPRMARICILLTPGASGPSSLSDTEIIKFDASPFSQQDIVNHLSKRLGYGEAQSQQIYDQLLHFRDGQRPGIMYDNLAILCELRLCSDYVGR